MIILGVDPGTLILGYGIIENKNHSLKILGHGIIRNTGAVSMPQRLFNIYSSLCSIYQEFQPDECAMESAFYHRNVQSALKIGEARGAAFVALAGSKIPIAEYSPREVKKSVTGSGAASKEQVQYMVMQMLHLKPAPKYFDITDALAVALCHSQRSSTGKKKYHDWKSFIASHPEKVIA